ncbi:MAG: hypothetical protein DME26_21605 [Verrucomicrobia bacterium]|nr:MAG: hypothetical protein DME26_21605 [Verrucomicrobiota bacterium]
MVLPAERRTGMREENKVFYIYQTDNRTVGIVSMLMTGAGLSVIYSSDYILDLIQRHQSRIRGMNGNIILFTSES